MLWILGIWICTSLGALLPLALSIWRIRRFASVMAMRFLQISLAGAIVHNVIASYLSISGMAALRALDQPATLPVILLTVGHLAQTLPVIAFSLYLLGLFTEGRTDAQREFL